MLNSWICLDANMVVRLITDKNDERILTQWQQWIDDGYQLAAPTLLHYEVTNAIYQYQKHNVLSVEATSDALETAKILSIQLFGDSALHQAAIKLAMQFSLPATYDAHYLALSKRLEAELWTADKKLVNAVKSNFPNIQLWT